MDILNAIPARVTLLFPDADDGRSVFPDEDNRPKYVVLRKWATEPSTIPGNPPVKYQPGVYHCTITKGTRSKNPKKVNTWICAPLEIIAMTWDNNHDNFGRILEFQAEDGTIKVWSMPMEILKDSGAALRRKLLSMGLNINRDVRKMDLLCYVASDDIWYANCNGKGGSS